MRIMYSSVPPVLEQSQTEKVCLLIVSKCEKVLHSMSKRAVEANDPQRKKRLQKYRIRATFERD